MSEPVIIQVIITAGAVLVGIISLVATYANRQDVKDVKEQVKNTHETNLRQDIDKVKEDAALASNSAHRTERFVEDLNTTIDSFEKSLERHTKLWAKAMSEIRGDVSTFGIRLDAHIEREVPDTVRKSLGIAKEEMRKILAEHEEKWHVYNNKEEEQDE
jgi:hypothetical protein